MSPSPHRWRDRTRLPVAVAVRATVRARLRLSVAASGIDPFRDRVAGGWILSESKCMQELMNHDDLGRRAIPLKRESELVSANAYERRPGSGERQRLTPAALWGSAIVEEPQQIEGLSRTLPACHQPGRKVLARLIGKVGENVLAAGACEAVGGAVDRQTHGNQRLDIHESDSPWCLGTRARCQ
jgi:hypothetical protein